MTRLLCIFLLLVPNFAYAKINVVTSITPLASLVAMIGGDKVTVSALVSSSGCPHHHALKPSDMQKTADSDLFIYIDDSFDLFAKLLLKKAGGKVMRISEIKSLKLLKDNWHLWLLPENAILILQNIKISLSELSPENEEYFNRNLQASLVKMQGLEKQRMLIISSDSKIVLLTDSAEYLFIDSKANLERLEHQTHPSIRMAEILKSSPLKACHIISSEQNLEKYKRLLKVGTSIVQLETENWQWDVDLENLYYTQYAQILHYLSMCIFEGNKL